MEKADVAVIGGGIVGLATAWQISQRRPELKVVVLEKEADLAHHQTGHNSGVLHAGVYYKPGSLKAINCRQGRELMFRFCDEEGIKYEICGKVVVAITKEELPSMEMIFERAKANGVDCEKISLERLKELEPHAAGVAA
ncbi:MAG: FAD-dependent oxidoreductase, partial [candidate division WOR-3 bacterium]